MRESLRSPSLKRAGRFTLLAGGRPGPAQWALQMLVRLNRVSMSGITGTKAASIESSSITR
jgi:hypothetical protein